MSEPVPVCSVLELGGSDPHQRLTWWCPGCRTGHGVPIPPHRQAWQWNGDRLRPTLTPSVLVTYDGPDAGRDGAPPAVCHCFIRDGQIDFLGDCTHDHAGRTVPLAPW